MGIGSFNLNKRYQEEGTLFLMENLVYYQFLYLLYFAVSNV